MLIELTHTHTTDTPSFGSFARFADLLNFESIIHIAE